ncbi:hypothetical protein BV210_13760 [Halorientalis sp. IM1011]|uniref:hypothetical protein n=1 Tax=Halorientalis sp. IM1011 TaxID=1932360 RepID=UPI00097CC4BB|nr:hypothetical protein [Halorientalis sp. IM1011]AQL43703.1 hypothetical protein BV210_13760 [Halorientalis sp. IM1011]
MTRGGETRPDGDGRGAPIDFDRLETIAERLATDDRFVQIEREPEFAPDRLVCTYDDRFYPSTVRTARLDIAWYENGDFSIHYHEDHDAGTFDHRWDRHPSDHNAREHVHPGPDAPTPGDDTAHPDDWRDVLSEALAEIERRQRAFWTA